MSAPHEIDRRDLLASAGLLTVGARVWAEIFWPTLAAADEPKKATIGKREIVKGLDGMSRAADGGDAFSTGHNAAAVISSAFFCKDEKLEEGVQKEILSVIETRLLTNPIYAPRPEEKADPELLAGIVKDLDSGIDTLRRAGHNIIFAATSLKALKEAPEAMTPSRVAGLRKTVTSFGTENNRAAPLANKATFVGLDDEKKFIKFVFDEYLNAIDRYIAGTGRHGFAGHVLTVGHSLLELLRMGHKETAHKGVEAYWRFVQMARDEAVAGGKPLPAAPKDAPGPLAKDYWAAQSKRRSGEIVSSHLIKYPYSFFALAKELKDDELKKRLFEKVYHLTAVS